MSEDNFNKERNKQETKKRTIKALIFLGFVMLLFLIGEIINHIN